MMNGSRSFHPAFLIPRPRLQQLADAGQMFAAPVEVAILEQEAWHAENASGFRVELDAAKQAATLAVQKRGNADVSAPHSVRTAARTAGSSMSSSRFQNRSNTRS